MELALAKHHPPPRGTPILAQILYRGITRPATERVVCVIDEDDGNMLLSEGGDDLGWQADAIVAWAPLPPLLTLSPAIPRR